MKRVAIKDEVHAAALLREALPDIRDVTIHRERVRGRLGTLIEVDWVLVRSWKGMHTQCLYVLVNDLTVWSSPCRPNKNTDRAIRTALKTTEAKLSKQLHAVKEAQRVISCPQLQRQEARTDA